MDTTNDECDLMLNEIRKELMAIIEDSSDPSRGKLSIGANIKRIQVATKDDVEGKYNIDPNFNTTQKAERAMSSTRAIPTTDTNAAVSAAAPPTVSMPGSHNIDEDLENMRFHLNESYELFQSIGDRFENLNFNGLLNRIKDLNLSDNKSNVPLSKIVSDLKGDFENNFKNNRLHELTQDMKTKFNNHPGEFGDIPEVCEFFRACTQLENGLDRLRKQRSEINNLSTRVNAVTGKAYKRVNIIQKTLNEQNGRGAAGDVGDKF